MGILDAIRRLLPLEDVALVPDAPPGVPRFLFLQVNKRCNLRCLHCSFWHEKDTDRANYLDAAGKQRLMGEFHALNPRGAVVICGGESMLDLEDYFGISKECRSLGLTCVSVINGTRVRNAEMADRLLREGPHEISVSLNSHRPSLHDETRGVRGSFDKAVQALRLLLDARARQAAAGMDAPKTRIYVMGLIFNDNYRELEDFYDFVLNDVGADKLKLNFLQPSFGDTEVDHFFAERHRMEPNELVSAIRRCDARFGLGLTEAWIGNVRMYVESLQGANDLVRGWGADTRTRDHICNTYERNIMVDHYGVARLCFSTEFRGVKLEQSGDLARFWRETDDVREQMRQCNRFCGISHSVRRVSATTTPAAYSLPERSPTPTGVSAGRRILLSLSQGRWTSRLAGN
ncbi:radical SAM protein [Ancylobacter sonchi]|uniref:radical SAM protein n=1 Tax=Ancylobacter sonchi TaxID=1937790 RepID=UPI001BD58FD4|nr:radical SAM protein [Ancylobacter sonchi]MBS7532526.1 radical SAM protein [Ancylobacter sonchi]